MRAAATTGRTIETGTQDAAVAPVGGSATNIASQAGKPAPSQEEKSGKDLAGEPAVLNLEWGEADPLIEFNVRPDERRLADWIGVAPAVGPIAVSVSADWKWNDGERQNFWRVRVHAKYAYRTEYVVTVRKGLPFQDGRTLAADFRRTVKRPDAPPSVRFASGGRYLPPAGRQTLEFEAVNVKHVECALAPVMTQNLVQLLAREEYVYDDGNARADSRRTRELAGRFREWTVELPSRPNVVQKAMLDVRGDGAQPTRGVYLASLLDLKDKRKDEYSWNDARRYKLVCVTDLGLSARTSRGAAYVWATSLVRGTPLAGVKISVYAANNQVLATATTDADGGAKMTFDPSETPFALVAEQADGKDVAFIAFGDTTRVDESTAAGTVRKDYLEPDACEAFAWTDRGIYRHGEKILLNALVRNGRGDAPRGFPLTVELRDPDGRRFASRAATPDARGYFAVEDLSVPESQMSGKWELSIRTPGKNGRVLGATEVVVEEFAPPQIRVKVVDLPPDGAAGTNFAFAVSAEHLFGGAAKHLGVEAVVSFADAPFSPKGWKGFRFGDETKGLSPNLARLPRATLDGAGRAVFAIGLPEGAEPKAAVKMTVQGTVFEAGGRPGKARRACVVHPRPWYVGVALPETLRVRPEGVACRVALVRADGSPFASARRLKASFTRLDTVYSLKKNNSGIYGWSCETVRTPLGDSFEVALDAKGEGTVTVPAADVGDYAVALADPETGASFGAVYWVGGANDESVRANLSNPSAIALTADKPRYFPGERPRLTVKAPFAGAAWLTVSRDNVLYARAFALTNATAEIELDAVDAAWRPNVDVALSVVQSAADGSKRLSHRANGLLPLAVATPDQLLAVDVDARVAFAPEGGAALAARISAPGATHAALTVVDEGINLLTAEKIPDPIGFFTASRAGNHPLYDLYGRLLPVIDGELRKNGVKTGGGADLDLMSRVSPVPTRRFKPLSLWRTNVALTDGKGEATFKLPEFVGEVRVTAVAWNGRGTGAGAIWRKVSPKVVAQPDAPRFAAPGDRFRVSLPLANRSGSDGEISWDVTATGAARLVEDASGSAVFHKDEARTLEFLAEAARCPGQATFVFRASGFGERHEQRIELPVRPAQAPEKTAEVVALGPGEEYVSENPGGENAVPEATVRMFGLTTSPIAELAAALEFLADYPHGCLEQTTSRIFPLVHAGGILNTLPRERTSVAADRVRYVAAGIARVASMVRENDFVMWPDVSQAPWDREVSLWAAQFLAEAHRAGQSVPDEALARVKRFTRRWALDTDLRASAYACLVLALADAPERDRMLRLFGTRGSLDALARARLARAFVRTGDRDRARELVAGAADAPADVKEAACALMTLLDLDPGDKRIEGLVVHLLQRRDRACGHWGTTAENAHALLALGAYFRHADAVSGEAQLQFKGAGLDENACVTGGVTRIVGRGRIVARNAGNAPFYLSVTRIATPPAPPGGRPAESRGLGVTRAFFMPDGRPADLGNLTRGDLLIAETTVTGEVGRVYSDLVVEDLFPACFEPERTDLSAKDFNWLRARAAGDVPQTDAAKWLLRQDLRDDRALAFSQRFTMPAKGVKFHYPVRVVGAGDFILPAPAAEAMYEPVLKARGASARLSVVR